MKRSAATCTVDGVFRAGRRAHGLTVAASTILDTERNGGRAPGRAAAYGVFPFLEAGTVSKEAGVPLLELY